jgi:hypothetical protein
MKSLIDLFVQEITRFPDVQETEGDRFGERSFRVGGREFLHVHGGSTVHILLPPEVKAEAMARGQAHQHPYAPRSGMVEFHLRREDQLSEAVGLAKKSYDYIWGRIQRTAPTQTAGRDPLM